MATRRRTARGQAQTEKAEVSFFDRLKEVPEEAWDTHKVYIYRRWPRILKSDAPHYLETVRHSIDEPWLLQHHGSGRYRLRLNDQRKTVESFVCEVHDLKRPPRLDPEELVECPENERYFELWPEAAKAVKAAEGDGGSDASATAVRELGRIARQAQAQGVVDEGLSKLFLSAAQARDDLVGKLAGSKSSEIETLDKVLSVVQRLRADNTPATTPVDPLTLMREVLQTVKEMQPAAAPAPSLLGQVKELGEVLKTFREAFPTFGEPTSGAVGTLQSLVEILNSPTVAGITEPLARLLMVKALGAATPAAPPATGRQQPKAGTPPTSPQAAAADRKEPQPEPEPDTAADVVANLVQFARQFDEAFQRDMAGDDFAIAVCVFQGEQMYEQIHELGEESVLQVLLPNTPPEHHTALKEFVREFFSYGDEETPQEPGESAAPDSPPPAPGPHEEAAGSHEPGENQT